MTTFVGLVAQHDYDTAVDRFLADPAAPIPVWVGDRDDLWESMAVAERFYRRGGAFTGGHAVEPASLPRSLLRMIGDGPVAVGSYEQLRFGDRTAPALDHFVTGRDLHSLSWMIAKQWASAEASGTLVVSALPSVKPRDDIAWVGPEALPQGVSRLAERPWLRVLVHGNGQDDSLNLGRHTICGRRRGSWTPQGYGPSCHFGQGCYKPDDGVLPVATITTESLALLNCFSGPSARLATYHADYQLLLAAIDGAARSVVALSTACDAGRPEIEAWLTQPEAPARAMNRAVATANPYPIFFQCGGEVSDVSQSATPPNVLSTQRLSMLSSRAVAMAQTGLLPDHHPLAGGLSRLVRSLTDASARDVRDVAGAIDVSHLEARVADLDVAMAKTLGSQGALSSFPEYFGVRSTALPATPAAGCPCGEPTSTFVREPIVAPLIATTQTCCDRCGDIENAFVGAPSLRAFAPRTVRRGETVSVTLAVTGAPRSTPIVGLALRPSLQAIVSPAARRVALDDDGAGATEFTMQISPETRAQAEYLLPFVVLDLGIAIGRSHVLVEP